jgi:hypothetical protein
MKKNTISIVILSSFSLIITLPLFLSNSLIISQDILWHFVWSEQFYKTLMEGVLYPRWVDTPFGYGSPTFIFYAPLTFYVISLINMITNSIILSMKVAIYFSFFLSGLGMYFFAKKLNGQGAGLISGVIYQLLPYHIFDLFGRGVVPELFAFIWFPLILLYIKKIFSDGKSSSVALMSCSYAGLILTHLVSSFMFTFVMIGYSLYLSLVEKEKVLILKVLFAMALGLGLSSIYLIPVIFERSFVHIEFIKIVNFRDSFLFIKNNLVKREFYPIVHGIAILEITFLIFSFLLIRKKIIRSDNIFFVLLLLLSLFLTTPLSMFIWRYVPEFSNLQFPWRWLTFSGLSVSIIGGNLIGNFKGEVRRPAGIFLLTLVIISFFMMLQTSFFKEGEIERWRIHPGLFSPFEYRPVWLTDPGRILLPVEKVIIVNGNGSVDIVSWKSNRRELSIKGTAPLMLKFSTFYYPGWIAKIDGRNASIAVDKDSGLILIDIPEGKHTLILKFQDTPIRYYSKIISLFSFVSLIFFLILQRKK